MSRGTTSSRISAMGARGRPTASRSSPGCGSGCCCAGRSPARCASTSSTRRSRSSRRRSRRAGRPLPRPRARFRGGARLRPSELLSPSMWGRVAALVVATAFAAAPAQAAVEPYGANDAGGFRNVLPPGEAGVDNALQLARFEADGTRPEHWDDQQKLYTGLVFASPTLRHDQIGDYFKDATFGVKAEDVASSISPRPGVTIIRDKQHGVPHVYGDTRADVTFGAGYAGAQDRLFLMDVLRHTGRATLSSFVGGSASNRRMDRAQWQIAPYTEADLQRQIDQAPVLYGDLGRQVIEDVTN